MWLLTVWVDSGVAWHKTADLAGFVEAYLAGLFEVLFQAPAGALNPGFRTWQTDALGFGVVGLGHAIEIAQANRFGILGRQFPECPWQATGQVIHRGLDRFFVGQFLRHILDHAMLASQLIDQAVSGDAVEPGPRVFERTKP